MTAKGFLFGRTPRTFGKLTYMITRTSSGDASFLHRLAAVCGVGRTLQMAVAKWNAKDSRVLFFLVAWPSPFETSGLTMAVQQSACVWREAGN